MFRSILTDIRTLHPLVHCITNPVSAGDCANLLLACGASPIMADAPEESAEITAGCRALVLNLGMPHPRRIEAMLRSGRQANAMGIPVLLDPVGVGASAYRRDAVQQLLAEIQLCAIRCNRSELLTLSDPAHHAAGVDALPAEEFDAAACAKLLALRAGAVVISSGAEDIVTDGETAFRITNGHPIQKQITGAGCMLSALTGAFLTADRSAQSCAAAVCAMGLAGELAASRMGPQDGNATCRNYLIDAIFNMTDNQLEEGARLEHLT